MYVFVLNKNKTASIPINSVEARLLLKNDKAKIYLKSPFVIQLYNDSNPPLIRVY